MLWFLMHAISIQMLQASEFMQLSTTSLNMSGVTVERNRAVMNKYTAHAGCRECQSLGIGGKDIHRTNNYDN